jgi:hypothetical protein
LDGAEKRSLGADERDEFLRSAWRLLFAQRVDAGCLVFVDEMGAKNVSLCPIYAWSRRGERAHAKVPRNWGKNVTLLASITTGGVGPCLAVEGPTTRWRSSKPILSASWRRCCALGRAWWRTTYLPTRAAG